MIKFLYLLVSRLKILCYHGSPNCPVMPQMARVCSLHILTAPVHPIHMLAKIYAIAPYLWPGLVHLSVKIFCPHSCQQYLACLESIQICEVFYMQRIFMISFWIFDSSLIVLFIFYKWVNHYLPCDKFSIWYQDKKQSFYRRKLEVFSTEMFRASRFM